jgi:hypothetical protein
VKAPVVPTPPTDDGAPVISKEDVPTVAARTGAFCLAASIRVSAPPASTKRRMNGLSFERLAGRTAHVTLSPGIDTNGTTAIAPGVSIVPAPFGARGDVPVTVRSKPPAVPADVDTATR